ncbi:hypothetical protein ACXPWS_23705 [Mycobacterium sp. BMJ-28]
MAAQEQEYGTLPPDEATDSDELRNADGDEVVDPPEQWQGSNKFGISGDEAAQGESLDRKLSAEEPEDGTSFFPVVR